MSEPTNTRKSDLDAAHYMDLIEEERKLSVRLADVRAEKELLASRLAARQTEPRERRQLAYRLPRVAEMLDVSVDVVKQQILSGELPSCLIGGCRVVLAGEIEQYLARRPERRDE